jgi:hypothetical protein
MDAEGGLKGIVHALDTAMFDTELRMILLAEIDDFTITAGQR